MQLKKTTAITTIVAITALVSAGLIIASDDTKVAEEKKIESVEVAESASVETADEKPYMVVDGMVDKATFNGYRRFHGTCHACHGQDASGGSFAPSLVESLTTLSYNDFVTTVTDGRQVVDASGGFSAMPSFGHDANIMKHLDDIYSYIKARSDGALGSGRPKKIPKAK